MSELVKSDEPQDVMGMTVEIVAAYAGRNQMTGPELIETIRSVHSEIDTLVRPETLIVNGEADFNSALLPAVPIDASVGEDSIVCLECGKHFKTLKRHLAAEHSLTPAMYREKWGLSKDYPIVAPSYSVRRSQTAKSIGLGLKTG